jgi:hypothetical protein
LDFYPKLAHFPFPDIYKDNGQNVVDEMSLFELTVDDGEKKEKKKVYFNYPREHLSNDATSQSSSKRKDMQAREGITSIRQ